ncbi:HTH-type transcriptional regulator AcrR family [Bordetella ansorpii]|uniref:HTH-type transcriptional regulator AcrR family n=1 Tax=Bordetella ansorpii TaxID=288768 RepID=A0A157S716_9BORD|nr:TetR/AcrR family transcriptional regulator [Bordetella ansorpii]SAI66185.1 HTH-type transcriptional regulator AcrR family [Bordetella ansorpii]
MEKVRLTREQSRHQTRQRLLDAGQRLFVAKGYTASSVEDIAEEAGYTRGAFYSNFGDKYQMLMELLRRDHEAHTSEMQAIFDGEATREDLESRIVAFYSQLYREDDCFLLWVEAKLLAARDPQFREPFLAFTREKRAGVAEYARQFMQRTGAPLGMTPDELALGLVALCEGVMFSHTFDPQEVTGELTEAVLGGFFRRVVFGRT